MMEKLNFPEFNVLIKNKENKSYIFDPVRKIWLIFTPEEWVRVHCIFYLIEIKKYPASLIRIEKELRLYNTKKRFDILVAGLNLKPLILVECKAPSVKINQKTFDQIARYNSALKSEYLMLTNDINHFFCKMDFQKGKYIFLQDLPFYNYSQ